MATAVAIGFFLILIHHSLSTDLNSITASDFATTPSSAIFTSSTLMPGLEADLENITSFCMTNADYEQLWDHNLKYGLAENTAAALLRAAAESIGREELRTALKMPPPPPWRNSRSPSKDELANATTIEAYFELREPITPSITLDSPFFFEHQLPPAMALLELRLPIVRTIFRRQFEAALKSRPEPVIVDRKLIDEMCDELVKIRFELRYAFMTMQNNDNDCRPKEVPSKQP